MARWLSRSTTMLASMTTSVGRSFQLVDHHGDRVRDLLAEREEELLADELGGQEALRAIGQWSAS